MPRTISEDTLTQEIPDLIVCLHGIDAGPRSGRQPDCALHLLGTDRFHLVLVDRIRARPIRSAPGGLTGPARHRGWWSCAPGCRYFALAGRWYHKPVRTARPRIELRRCPDLRRDHRSDPARRVHQVCAIPLPFLAPECDAGTHTRQCVSALCDDGQSWRVP